MPVFAVSWLDKLSFRDDALLPFDRSAAVGLRFPIFKNDGNAVALRWIGSSHDMKMKVRFAGISGVSDLTNGIACFDLRSDLNTDASCFQVCVIAKLAIAMIDDNHIASGSVGIGIARIIVCDVGA